MLCKEKQRSKLGERITKMYHPVRANATSLKFGFYVTSNPKAQFVTDPEVTKIGSIKVQSPGTWRGKIENRSQYVFRGN